MEVIIAYLGGGGGGIFEMTVGFFSEKLHYGVLDAIRRKLSP